MNTAYSGIPYACSIGLSRCSSTTLYQDSQESRVQSLKVGKVRRCVKHATLCLVDARRLPRTQLFFLNHASNAQSFQCFTRFCKFLRTISECHATLHDCRHLLWGALKFLSDISQNMEGVYLPEIKACFASVVKLSNWQFLCIRSRILRSLIFSLI